MEGEENWCKASFAPKFWKNQLKQLIIFYSIFSSSYYQKKKGKKKNTSSEKWRSIDFVFREPVISVRILLISKYKIIMTFYAWDMKEKHTCKFYISEIFMSQITCEPHYLIWMQKFYMCKCWNVWIIYTHINCSFISKYMNNKKHETKHFEV